MPKRSRPTSSPALAGTALLETLLGGWRALSRLEVDGFAVQRSRGVTRRANSVIPIDPPTDTAALDAALTRIESLLAAAGESPTFRLFSADGLDHEPVRAALEQRGYAAGPPVHVLLRPLADLRTAPDPRAAITVGAPPENWLEASWRFAPRPDAGARETLREIMAGTPAIYLALTDPGSREIDAVGRAALVPHRRRTIAVLDQIAVDPGRRREGLGRAVVRSLLSLAAVQGADLALLEVETGNTAARALYRGEGFTPCGEYRYLTRP
ncbi:GNAT family N-acetyltransferase [Brachybacterium atlanticum]|uniref:GNAT family N-acetyltransferase n=1 Tax=Brachybacterium atlanticum TaxID=2911888 RepID=UPI0021E050C1|nr:GNAT family N-acetyltransferase [Brachybacterium atlanticum]